MPGKVGRPGAGQGRLFPVDVRRGGKVLQSQQFRWVDMDSSRVTRATYDSKAKRVSVVFRDGTPWHYEGVSRHQWYRMQKHPSPGRYINTLTERASSHGRGLEPKRSR